MSAAPLTSGIDVDLIYENMKYVVQVGVWLLTIGCV